MESYQLLPRFTQADVEYIETNFVFLDTAPVDGPAAAYVLDDGRRFYPADYEQQQINEATFRERLFAEMRAQNVNIDAQEAWSAYMTGIYGVCLRNATPENIVRKAALLERIDRLSASPREDSDEWRSELTEAVDALDALERPFSPDYDRSRFGRPPTRDSHIRDIRILTAEQLQVRPPGERVPAAMQGTALGAIFARMVRFNEGERHRELRGLVEQFLARWNLDEIAALTREAADRVPQDDIAGYVVASMIGIRDPQGALGCIRDFAAAIAAGADDDTIAHGIPAADALLTLLPSSDPDEQANLLGFLFQSYAATAKWIERMRQGHSDPPVLTTRRFAAADVEICGKQLHEGEVVAVTLEPENLRFGAGRHACPGRAIAETIAKSVSS